MLGQCLRVYCFFTHLIIQKQYIAILIKFSIEQITLTFYSLISRRLTHFSDKVKTEPNVIQIIFTYGGQIFPLQFPPPAWFVIALNP